ncbi:MAG: helix-turn-helix domain-containing protein [Thioalkalispiraceae bacterium]
MSSRKYTKRQRAQTEQETRQRIVEAAMQLHEEVGPRNTSISAIAERAGVQRLTVYRHFEDDNAIFAACSAHWLELNPPPDPQQWQTETDPIKRTENALLALYNYYRQTASMWSGVYRDLAEVPAMQLPMKQFEHYLKGIRDDLLTCWCPDKSGKTLYKAMLHHAVQFSTWQSFHEIKLRERQIAGLMTHCICAIPKQKK